MLNFSLWVDERCNNYVLECCLLLDNAANKPCNGQKNVDPNVQQTDEVLSAAKLKKKEVHPKEMRRKKTRS